MVICFNFFAHKQKSVKLLITGHFIVVLKKLERKIQKEIRPKTTFFLMHDKIRKKIILFIFN